VNPSQVAADSKDRKRKTSKPSTKTKKRRKVSVEDEDDCRPHSDKGAFDSLASAKALYRANKANMAKPTKTVHRKPAKRPTKSKKREEEDDESPAKQTRSQTSKRNGDAIGHGSAITTRKKSKNVAGDENIVLAETPPEKPNGDASDTVSGAKIPRKAPRGEAVSANGGKKRKDMTEDELCHLEMDEHLEKQYKQDRMVPPDKRLELISKLRKKIYVYKIDVHNNAHWEQQCYIMEKKAAILEKKAKVMKETKEREDLVAQDSAVIMKINQEILKQVREVSKGKLWKSIKFITTPALQIRATMLALNNVDLPQMQQGKDAIASAVAAYKGHVKRFQFDQKNYVQQEFKKLAFAMLKVDKVLPTPEMVYKCAMRQINAEDEDEMLIFMWYWEELLPKMVGAKEWCVSKRYYNTISSATDETTGDLLISNSDEAMTAVLWDNCHDRWITLYNWTQLAAHAGAKQPNLAGKYTETDKGQCMWGGWKNEGLEVFNTTFLEVKRVRKTTECADLEDKTLVKLKEKHEIVCETHEAQEKLVRSVKRKLKKGEKLQAGQLSTMPPPPKKSNSAQPLVDSDSEDQDCEPEGDDMESESEVEDDEEEDVNGDGEE
jgi:hypothetical protein